MKMCEYLNNTVSVILLQLLCRTKLSDLDVKTFNFNEIIFGTTNNINISNNLIDYNYMTIIKVDSIKSFIETKHSKTFEHQFRYSKQYRNITEEVFSKTHGILGTLNFTYPPARIYGKPDMYYIVENLIHKYINNLYLMFG